MKARVRPLEDSDLQESLERLRVLVRPYSPEAHDTAWQSSVWSWLGSHPLADKMHRWVLEAEGEIVGHLAALPQYYRINGRRIIAYTPADYMVLPEYGFHAITLMRRFFRTCDNCVTWDSAPAVIGVETRLGAEEAGKIRFGAKPWNISEAPGFPTSVPAPVRQVCNWGLRTLDRALNDTTRIGDLKVEVLEGFDESCDELFEDVAASVPCAPEKDAAFLRWRYGSGSPQASTITLGVKDGENLLGYAALWVTADGLTGYLLDLTTRPGRRDVARALLREAVRHFRRLRVHSVRYRFVESPTSPRARDLWRSGFFPGSKRHSVLLVKLADSDLHEIANDAARWSYNFGDVEGSFWIR